MRPMRRYTSPMSRDFRLPRAPVDVLDYEIAQDMASALGRMGRALEEALAKLREFDAAYPRSDAAAPARQARHTLVIEAGHALWMFVVQREACGLRDSRTICATIRCRARCSSAWGRSPPPRGGPQRDESAKLTWSYREGNCVRVGSA
jgi:hypothetical protein